MKQELKIVVINPPDQKKQEEFIQQIKDYIQINYYS